MRGRATTRKLHRRATHQDKQRYVVTMVGRAHCIVMSPGADGATVLLHSTKHRERGDWVGVLCDEDASLGQLSCMQIDTGCEPWRVDAMLCSATPSTCAICSSVSERVRRPQAGTAPGRPLTRRGSRWYDLLVNMNNDRSATATTSTRGSTSTRVPELRWRSSRRTARCAGGTTPS